MDKVISKIVEEVTKKQKVDGLNSSQMARKLNISRSYWYQIKVGQKQPEKDFLSVVAYLYPDLQLLVNQELIETGKNITEK